MIEQINNKKNYLEDSLKKIDIKSTIERGLLLYQSNLESEFSKLSEALFSKNGIYIFGSHTVGKQVLIECEKRNINVIGFLDNSLSKIGTSYCNKPVLSPQIIIDQKEVGILIASGNYSYEIRKQLDDLQYKNIISLSAFYFIIEAENQPEKNFKKDLSNNIVQYQKLFDQLDDFESKKTLMDLVQFRLSFDLEWLAKAKVSDHKQWFSKDFYCPNLKSVFVDGGGFDGDTAEEFIKFSNSNYNKIYVFEPDLSHAEKAKERLKQYPNVTIISKGLSDRNQNFYFNSTGVTNGFLESQGNQMVQVDSIDNVVKEPITFLKLDVEGFEEEALWGAKDQIEKNNPTIALAVYHKVQDLWSLPQLILKINKNYKFYLRHYTQSTFESVIYAKPK